MEKLSFLSTAVLVGELATGNKNGINMINAPGLAREAGIEISANYGGQVPSTIQETKVVRVTIERSGESHTILGKLF